jgi:hypothetical protein
MLIDRKTGETTCVAVPLCGNTNYLRAFHDNRVKYPQGEQWRRLRPAVVCRRRPVAHRVEHGELYDLWRNTPHATHGHESTSPDWQYIATDGGTTRIVHVRDGECARCGSRPTAAITTCTGGSIRGFFVGWVRGWHFGSYLRPENANIEFQVFCDGTFPAHRRHQAPAQRLLRRRRLLDAQPGRHEDPLRIEHDGPLPELHRRDGPPAPAGGLPGAPSGAVVPRLGALDLQPRDARLPGLPRRAQRRPLRLLTPEPVEATTWRDTTSSRAGRTTTWSAPWSIRGWRAATPRKRPGPASACRPIWTRRWSCTPKPRTRSATCPPAPCRDWRWAWTGTRPPTGTTCTAIPKPSGARRPWR